MTLVANNVRVAVTGAVSVGLVSVTAPVDADSPLAAGFADLGYLDKDGVKETRDRKVEEIKAWQHADIVREVVTTAKLKLKFTLIETKKETVQLYYGGTVTALDGSIGIVAGATGGRQSFVIDVVDGGDFVRTYVPAGEVMDVGDQMYANGEALSYEVTLTCYPVAGISAKKFYSALVVP